LSAEFGASGSLATCCQVCKHAVCPKTHQPARVCPLCFHSWHPGCQKFATASLAPAKGG
jgi:uncharacterized CHY-type Zn-finger protein